jgi:hypothetical protein
MLEVYDHTNSVYAQKVRLTLAEKKLEWTRHLLRNDGDQFAPNYRRLKPAPPCARAAANGIQRAIDRQRWTFMDIKAGPAIPAEKPPARAASSRNAVSTDG